MSTVTYDSFRCVSWDEVQALPTTVQRQFVRLPHTEPDHQQRLEWLAQNDADVALFDSVMNPATFERMFAKVLFYDADHFALYQLAFPG